MKVDQFPYLSPEALELRRRDGTPPWAVHVCEVDSLGPDCFQADTAGLESYLWAVKARKEIDAEGEQRKRRRK